MEMMALNKRRNDDLITVSWMTAHYSAYNFSKQKMPKLVDELKTPEDQKERDQESRDFIKALAEAGKIKLYKGEKVIKNEQ